jgi:hypothetical protein
MAVVMEMAPVGASLRDVAVKARTSESWARVALRLLREAPDIAQDVSDGAVGLTYGYRVMFQRKFAAGPGRQIEGGVGERRSVG